MIAVLAAAWFSAVQYTPHAVSLRGCAECKGEPDDVCEVHAGAQLAPLDEYPKPAGGRIHLLGRIATVVRQRIRRLRRLERRRRRAIAIRRHGAIGRARHGTLDARRHEHEAHGILR